MSRAKVTLSWHCKLLKCWRKVAKEKKLKGLDHPLPFDHLVDLNKPWIHHRKLLYGYLSFNLLEPILRSQFKPTLLCAAVNVLIWLVKDPSFNTTFIFYKESGSAGNSERNVIDLLADLIQTNSSPSSSLDVLFLLFQKTLN